MKPSPLIARALAAASDTRALLIDHGALSRVGEVFAAQFGSARAVIVSDTITLPLAGLAVIDALKQGGQIPLEPFVYADPNLYAEHSYVEELEASLRAHDAIPIAVGSGTINDLVKLASHRTGRPYLCVATAASMDGYTAFGASITHRGSKQTFTCPAPRAVVADLDILCAAPPEMTASGYADLLAKITAGADWILADAVAVEPIDPTAWDLVQNPLREALADPEKVRRHDPAAIRKLIEGLMLSGFAMQASKSSRPASGAEHQFSHLWDMQHHTHNGTAPSHGFKVGVATLAVSRLYEFLLARDSFASVNWPTWKELEPRVAAMFKDDSEIAAKAIEETKAKYLAPDALAAQMRLLAENWSATRDRLRQQLISSKEMSQILRAAGAPTDPDQIGITPTRLCDSHRLALHIRRRYTILDVLDRAGLLDDACAQLEGPAPSGP